MARKTPESEQPVEVTEGEAPEAVQAEVESAPESAASSADAELVSAESSAAPAEPAPPEQAPAEPAPDRVVYLATPPPPKLRGNRGVGAVLALLGVLAFALAYAAAMAIVIPFYVSGALASAQFAVFVQSPDFWVPILVFLVSFVAMVLLINRGGWWVHVLASAIVAFVVYFGSIGILLLLDVILRQQSDFAAVAGQPTMIVAAIVAREVAIWIGLGVAARGRRVRVRNAEARAAFDREVAERRAEHERAAAEG